MSLRVRQLNADTTFLLTFYPPFAPSKLSKRVPGDFTILLDPWLRGYASMLHPSFQISHHTSTPALQSLQELQQLPDIIVISQDRPDHCHRQTLCSIPKSSETSILATPAAAKRIRSWRHFEPDQVLTIPSYNPFDADSVIRIPIPGYSASSADGEITLTNIPTKRDIAGVHNAIGITYQPASSVLTIDKRSARPSNNHSTATLSERGRSSASASQQRSRTTSGSSPQSTLHFTPHSRADSGIAASSSPDAALAKNQEEVLSIIYTPHGISTNLVEPYLHHHLTPLAALPVCTLLHSLNVETNPWFLGGVIATGAPGGVELAQRIGAKHWIAAHDERKLNKGLAAKLIKSRLYDAAEVEEMLRQAGLPQTTVYQLAVGEVVRIPGSEGAGEAVVDRTRWGVGKGLSMGKGQRMNVEKNVLAMPEPMRPLTAPQCIAEDPAAVAPGTQIRIRREISHPDGMWI